VNKEPLILHIDLGNQSISEWITENKYVIYSELLRYAEKLIENDLDQVQALMVSNLSDNMVFILKKVDVDILFEKAMSYFLSIEEYEQCAKIRDLEYLLKTKKVDESKNTENSKSNKRKSKKV
jgi:hypothetical protein